MSVRTAVLFQNLLMRFSQLRVESRHLNGLFRYSTSFEEPPKTQNKKKKLPEIRINLFSRKKEMTVTTLEEAQKIAKRKGMLLVKPETCPKYMKVGDREAYELILPSDIKGPSPDQEFIERGLKGLKHILLSAKIEKHDLMTKIKKADKMLSRGFATEILIESSEDNKERLENVLETIESNLSHAQIPGKITSKKKSSLRVLFEPSLNTSKDVPTKSISTES